MGKINTENIEVDISQTPEKFQGMFDEIVNPLLKLLDELCTLEMETYAKSEAANDDSIDFFSEYRKRYGELIKPMCTEKLMECNYAVSYGSPAEYEFLRTGCKLFFIMKSCKRAAVEFQYDIGILKKKQFILMNIDGEWKISSVKYSFSDEKSWHKDSI